MLLFLRDIRFGLRKFLHAPGLTLAAVVTLTLGIGANTAIFSLVDGVWLRPLQIADPSHLIVVQSVKEHATAESESGDTGSSFREFEDLRQRVPAFSDVAATSGRGVVIDQGDGLKLLMARVVSENYFDFMGAHAWLGRLPSRQEMLHAETPVMMLGYSAWKSVFAGNPAVVGSTVKVSHGFVHIVGVLAPGFRGTDRMIDPQVYVSRAGWVAWDPDAQNSPRTIRDFDLYARLRPGATLSQAREQLSAAGLQLAAAYPEANNGRTFSAQWESDSVDRQIKLLSTLLLGIALAVLLIACTNIVNLLLALGDARRHEISTRVALGASRAQLLRQLVTEYCLLAVVSIAGAVFLGNRLIALVPRLIPDIGFPIGFDLRIDIRVLSFTIAAGLLSVLLCGLLPAILSSHVSPLEAARARLAPTGRLKMPVRKIFVVTQLSVSMALLVATALLVRTLIHVEAMDLGFKRAQNALLVNIAVDRQGPQQQILYGELAARMKALPGVNDASVARVVPLPENGGGATQTVLAPGETPSPTAGTRVWFNIVDDAYFRVMGVSLMRGRTFDSRDTSAGQRVAILNQTLAKKLFGTEEAVGRHIRLGNDKPVDVEIVGVARDGRYSDVTETPQPFLYLPFTQNQWSEVIVIVTTAGNPAALVNAARRAVREVDSKTLIMSTEALTDHMQLATYSNRMAAWLTASLGLLALLLTAVGLYGVTAYSVTRRTREIGIRVAVGAQRSTIFMDVLRDGLKLALAGLVFGAALAVFLGRAMSSMLYQVSALDPLAFVTVSALLLAVSFIALAAPARRALRVDPIQALRDE
ncbi:MAG TPA: ABC transporter permease [Terracidiphilus sp.]|nr:ABC transporter permease [Terracidiphilus sp.]